VNRVRRNASPAGPMTLGNAAAAHVRLIVWCRLCGYRAELDPAVQAAACGDETPVPEWGARLRCSGCGSRDTDFVVSGAAR
jgi:hypothetical protein